MTEEEFDELGETSELRDLDWRQPCGIQRGKVTSGPNDQLSCAKLTIPTCSIERSAVLAPTVDFTGSIGDQSF